MKMLEDITGILELILILVVIADSPITLVAGSGAVAIYMVIKLIAKRKES